MTLATRILTYEYLANLVVLAESGEILELLYLSSVITKHFVEEQVAVLKTSSMNRDDGNAFLEKCIVRE